MESLIIHRHGSNQTKYTFALTFLIKIVLCSKFLRTKFINHKCLHIGRTLQSWRTKCLLRSLPIAFKAAVSKPYTLHPGRQNPTPTPHTPHPANRKPYILPPAPQSSTLNLNPGCGRLGKANLHNRKPTLRRPRRAGGQSSCSRLCRSPPAFKTDSVLSRGGVKFATLGFTITKIATK